MSLRANLPFVGVATHSGTLNISDGITCECMVLDNGLRGFNWDQALALFGPVGALDAFGPPFTVVMPPPMGAVQMPDGRRVPFLIAGLLTATCTDVLRALLGIDAAGIARTPEQQAVGTRIAPFLEKCFQRGVLEAAPKGTLQ